MNWLSGNYGDGDVFRSMLVVLAIRLPIWLIDDRCDNGVPDPNECRCTERM